ncbi:helix-turn-helix transcriptional regulator [Ferrimonas lipolytica]|uniref:WYL domain-containing transcriptional regulator n=1 Tax=Ferrimonas lipolytica TaxID=2724191 RepID=A0A6H1UF35_9GAMM|nr:WYL domain-containing transcriptional regulator [Ferrimonas lipolytica]QIZ77717.1 WYL domain-containing transcriptional regulator [Ferrimonas lipolytica]
MSKIPPNIRIAQLAKMLLDGQCLEKHALAAQFNVDEKTIRRDFAALAVLGTTKTSAGTVMTNPLHKQVAQLADLGGLSEYQRLRRLALERVELDKHSETVRQRQLEKHRAFVDSITDVAKPKAAQTLEQDKRFIALFDAIERRQTLSFSYRRSDGQKKHYEGVQPYFIRRYESAYYVVCFHQEIIKPFRLEGLERLVVGACFPLVPEVLSRIQARDTIYFGKTTPAKIWVANDAIHYFERKQLLPNQQSGFVTFRGGYIIDCAYSAEVEILPIIKHWLPRIKVLAPKALRDALMDDLQRYLAEPQLEPAASWSPKEKAVS